MAWELSDDVDAFASAAGDFLRSRPVQHTVFLTIIDSVRRKGPHTYGPADPVYGWWRTAEGLVDGVLLQTPPYPMGFSALPAEAVPAAVDLLASRGLTGVNLQSATAEVFVDAWQRRTGATATVQMRTRLYRLGALAAFDPPPGAARIAGEGDRDLLVRWTHEFHEAIGLPAGPSLIDEWISRGLASLWEVDGVPVAMATRSLPEADMIRIRSVYTPAASRGHGYGGAVTVAATREALATGVRDVVLFTDQANATSNGLYRRLGYEPVEERTVVEFS